ncbi:MAG: cation:proton antiporter, partial [Deltaproteobacteria bacterium]|nr:cation:proton antiporter [Deltaproteobacteria bacterium]
LLPIFFMYSGLNTRIDLVVAPSLWVTTLAVIAIAVVGKGAACAIVARLSGEGWRAACAIGALMNARGLMELILLNIGLSHGIITPAFFSIMVVMAVVTTLMATPLFQLALFQSTLSCAEVAGIPLRDRHEPGAPQEPKAANG